MVDGPIISFFYFSKIHFLLNVSMKEVIWHVFQATLDYLLDGLDFGPWLVRLYDLTYGRLGNKCFLTKVSFQPPHIYEVEVYSRNIMRCRCWVLF